MKKSTLLALFILIFTNALAAEPVFKFKNEIVVRTVTNIKSKDDVDRLVELCLSSSIKTITLSFKQDEDDEIASGMVFYQSAIAPVAPGYEREDLMRYMIFKTKKAGLSVQAWVPQFHDQIAAKRDPAWEMSILKEGRVIPFSKFSKSYFVNPIDPQVQKYQLSIIEEIVSNYDVDAVVLDWLRFDDYNMDLGEVSREIFRKRYGYDPIEIDFSKDSKRRREWNDFRKSVIGEYVKVVKESIERLNPKMELGIFILSPYWSEVAQDPAKFHRYVDFLFPMSYYDDWGYPIDWIYSKEREDSILPLVAKRAPGVKIIPVFDEDWSKEAYEKIFSNLKGIDTISWFKYGKWKREDFSRVKANTIDWSENHETSFR